MKGHAFALPDLLVRRIALGPEGRLLAILSRDEWCIWDPLARIMVVRFDIDWDTQRLRFEGLAVSCDGAHFLAHVGSHLTIWNAASQARLNLDLQYPIAAVGLSPDASTVAALSDSGRLHLLRKESADLAEYLVLDQPFAIPITRGQAFCFSSDGRYLAAVGVPPYIDIVDLQKGTVSQTIRSPSLMIEHVALNRDASRMVAMVVERKPFTALVWDLHTETLLSQIKLDGPEDGLHDLALNPNGTCWAGVRESTRSVQIQAIPSGEKCLLGSDLGRQTVFSPSGEHLAAIDFNDQLNLWRIDEVMP